MRIRRSPRAGTTAVEAAFVYPVTILLVLGLVVGASGMYRYQEMAHLARLGARYAATHGAQYAADTGHPAATPADIYDNAIAPRAHLLDPSKLSYSVAYHTSNELGHSTVVDGDLVMVQNTVTVTVTYQWVPEAFLGGITLSSTAVMPMSY